MQSKKIYKGLMISSLMLVCALFQSCASRQVVVNNCPAWLEAGTVSLQDTRPTKAWMAEYETNRQRECK